MLENGWDLVRVEQCILENYSIKDTRGVKHLVGVEHGRCVVIVCQGSQIVLVLPVSELRIDPSGGIFTVVGHVPCSVVICGRSLTGKRVKEE